MGLDVGSMDVRGPRRGLTYWKTPDDWRVGKEPGNFGVLNGVCRIRDLSLVLVGVLKGCRSGETAGRVWRSLRCGRGSVFWGAMTVESESGDHFEETQ